MEDWGLGLGLRGGSSDARPQIVIPMHVEVQDKLSATHCLLQHIRKKWAWRFAL
jgi:hypothetical protein